MTRQINSTLSFLHFLGGPLDGYTETTDTPHEQMLEVLRILVSPEIIEMLTTQRLEAEAPATSLAFYQFQQKSNGDQSIYRFVGSTSPEVINQDDFGVPHA